MGKLIDSDWLRAQWGEPTDWMDGDQILHHYTWYKTMIDVAPTVDAVPVVRCAVCRHFQCNMRGDGTLPNGVDEFECRNGRGGCDPMGFCDEGERKDGDNHES